MMQEIINDRNNELKSIRDPRSLVELKGILF